MRYKLIIILVIFLASCNTQKSADQKNDTKETMNQEQSISHNLSMYPKATEVLKRHIISIPQKEDETNYKVELYVGKMAEVDCNKSTLSGDFTKEVVSGWGYSFYNFNTNGLIMSTQMACPDDSIHKEFITSASEIIRYNSKLPIVVYTPKEYEVRYKIWSRDHTEHTATLE
ncbi:serine protease inhibitor ecotin [Tamlana sp. 2201CG12-4]|uniref:serine protease inhibitor ecotin n=1 Tax=Tamlana sp. 2201CG12-4 TaxID=3112582 RepID=UPI002DBA4163|nr:serine protease inhibitor ecotin [Tamlana sp. 2201CG12-4]MEC3907388.1 serine protease inhibitor ecotin [Tamlana sp. 2201CG12-4]